MTHTTSHETLITPVELPVTGFVRLPTILKLIPVSSSVWWRGVRSGKYPQSVKLSKNCTAWRVEDIRALIDQLSQ